MKDATSFHLRRMIPGLGILLLAFLGLAATACSSRTAFLGKWQADYPQHSGWVYALEIKPDGTCHLLDYWVHIDDASTSFEQDVGFVDWEMDGNTIRIGPPGAPQHIGRIEDGKLSIIVEDQPVILHRVKEFAWRIHQP